MTVRVTRAVWVRLVLVVAGLALVGVVAGVVWEWIWTPTVGVVAQDAKGHHLWSPADALGLQHEFSGTGWYVVVGLVAGLVAGVLVGLLADEVPLLTLVAVVVGSALGAWLMLVVGSALGPADPDGLVAAADVGTRLPDNLEVSGRSPFIAYPAGVLIGLIAVFIGLAPRGGWSGAADRGDHGPGDGGQVGRGDLEVEAPAARGDEDRPER